MLGFLHFVFFYFLNACQYNQWPEYGHWGPKFGIDINFCKCSETQDGEVFEGVRKVAGGMFKFGHGECKFRQQELVGN